MKASPEYATMSFEEQKAVMMEFLRMLDVARQNDAKPYEAPEPQPKPEGQEREKSKIDEWLDEQCEIAEMSNEELNAIMEEAVNAEVQSHVSTEVPEVPQSERTVIYVPSHEDGLDDEEEDLRLYGGLYSN